MREIIETLSTYIARIEKLKKQMKKSVILSTDVKIATLRDRNDKRIKKVPIAWPLYGIGMFYVVTVPAKKHIRRHSHDEDIFRYVVKGSLLLNGSIRIKDGMWFVIKANTPYEIDTERGYTTIVRYGKECKPPGPRSTHWIEN